MKKQLFCLAIFLVHFSANAQNLGKNAVASKNAIYLTIMGEGSLSAHYNRIIVAKSQFFLDGKIGIGIVAGILDGEIAGNSVSHSVSANIGRRHSLELGIGGAYFQAFAEKDKVENDYGLFPIMGYKFRSTSSRLTFRLSTHPMKPDLSVVWPISASCGIAF